MDIQLYNTLSHTKEIFKPLKAGEVSMYNCGPTVYDTPHIGNYRTFVMNDLIRRVFEYNSYKVIQTMNVTDVDDKTIRRSREEGISLHQLTQKYEKLFMEDIASLNILAPHHLIRATEYIPSMIELIQTLLNNGFAYTTTDGVYMSIEKVSDYGALAHLQKTDISKERISNDEYDKSNPHDFALWKFKTIDDGDNVWHTPFGDGRPGWHIECSAMAMKTLGETIDIHTGGNDLIFPHHTNEIAQSESATGKAFVHYWMHGGFMTVQEDKMAKSKNNFIKLETLYKQMISPIAYRYWLLTAHYRSPVNFTHTAVQAAQNALIRLIGILANYPEGGIAIPFYIERFNTLINDDIDTPKAMALVWDLIKDDRRSDADKRATIADFDRVLGLNLSSIPILNDESIPPEILALAEAREEARTEKDWAKADALRVEIEARGYSVLDSGKEFKVIRH